jgi:CRP-like cAMP-binding protein
LSDEALTSLTDHVRYLDYSPGNVVISEGTLGDTLYILSEGAVEVVMFLEKPEEKVLATLKQGEIFGEMCIIDSVVRSASVRAVAEPTVVVALHRSDLHRLFKTDPTQFSILILNISRGLCRRLRTVDELYAARAD